MARRGPSLSFVIIFMVVGSACKQKGRNVPEDKELRERDARERRLRRLHHQRIRDERRKRAFERLKKSIHRETQRGVFRPDKGCDPLWELNRAAHGGAATIRLAQAIGLWLEGVRSEVLELDGKLRQRLSFRLRMHPAREPRLGRPRFRSGSLELWLRFRPLCSSGATRVWRTRLKLPLAAPGAGGSKVVVRPHARSARRARRRPAIPAGAEVQLVLDPARATLESGGAELGAKRLGRWEITAASITGSRRLRRMAVTSSALGPKLARVYVVEVACPSEGGRCRFATRQRGARETPVPLHKLMRHASPISRPKQVEQLHKLMLLINYHRCLGDAARPKAGAHPCLGDRDKDRLHCLFWRAREGKPAAASPRAVAGGFSVAEVLACPGKRVRFVYLQARYAKNGELKIKASDLTSRETELADALRKMQAP